MADPKPADVVLSNDKVIPALVPLARVGAPHLLENGVTTALIGRDQAHLNQPWVNARTILSTWDRNAYLERFR